MTGLFSREMRRRLAVTPEERRIVLWAGAYFFFVLAGYSILRPLREQMGVAGGIKNLPWLFLCTLAVMLVANPIYGWIVSRLPRQRFIPLVYRFFMLNLLAFFFLMSWAGGDMDIWVGRAFFVWLSVFNLFVVAVFWSFMADNFGSRSAKRLYAWIAVGGTLGSIAGSLLTWGGLGIARDQLGDARVDELLPWFLLLSIVLLEVGVQCVRRLAGLFAAHAPLEPKTVSRAPDRLLGGGAIDGLSQVARSPYLRRICLYLLCYTVTGSLLYFMQAQIVAGHFESRAARTEAFALIDLATQTATLCVQIFLTSRLIAGIGIGGTLTVLPITAGLAFIALATVPTFAVLVVAQGLRRSARYAVTKPAREVLFSPLERTEKYKAKAVIDTFVYRTGDAVGAGAYKLVTWASAAMGAVAAVAVPIAAGWTLLALGLGRAHSERVRIQEDGQEGPEYIPPSPGTGPGPEAAPDHR